MLNLKKLHSRLAFCYFILVVLLLFGCSTSNIVYRDVPIYIHTPPTTDTLLLRDTIYAETNDTLWYSDVVDSLNKKIGSVEVYYKKKIARLKLDAKTDTVIYRDTIEVSSNTNSILPIIVNSLNWWESLLFFGGMGLLTGLIGYLRLKRGKII